MKYFALSFDLEEFDIPLEFGKKIDKEEMFEISFRGTKEILNLLEKYNTKSTFFVTKAFYQKYPKLITDISKTHEIALHGEHNKNYAKINEDEALESLEQTKSLIERGIKKKITGFRAPRMLPPNYNVLKEIGIKYDASLHPTYIPTRYNNLFKPRKIFRKEGIKIIPTSVAPFIRLPITYLWFRNFGLNYTKICTNLCSLTDTYGNIYFHPWEFISLKNQEIPKIFKKNTGKKMIIMLDKYIRWLKKKRVNFVTLDELSKLF